MLTCKPIPTCFLLTVLLLVIACKKHSDAPPPNPLGPNMYVLGINDGKPAYWNNGTVYMTPADTATFSPFAFLVSGSDIYFAGSTSEGPFYMGTSRWYNAHMMKNGSRVQITAPFSATQSSITGLAALGSDIYASGMTTYDFSRGIPAKPASGRYLSGSLPTLWKNGIPQNLPLNALTYTPTDTLERYSGYSSGIFISGNDIYVAGGDADCVKGNPSTYQFAGYWKNGVFVNLSAGLVDSNANFINRYPQTSGICVSGSDVYVCGTATGDTFPQALYWKNGVVNKIGPGGLTNSAALCISATGNDVYVGGNVYANGATYATVWKNGVESRLAHASRGSSVSSILVSGGDVYVTGYDFGVNTGYATYWKNGVPVHLSTTGTARAIIIKP